MELFFFTFLTLYYLLVIIIPIIYLIKHYEILKLINNNKDEIRLGFLIRHKFLNTKSNARKFGNCIFIGLYYIWWIPYPILIGILSPTFFPNIIMLIILFCLRLSELTFLLLVKKKKKKLIINELKK